MEATWKRREFPSPDGRWTLRLVYVTEARMGMDVYDIALDDAGREVSGDHPALTQRRERGWARYIPTVQPWSADSRFVVVGTWGTRDSRESTFIYDVMEKRFHRCPLNAHRAEASPARPQFLLANRGRAILLTTMMDIQADVSVAQPGSHAYWQWLPYGTAFLHFPGWSESKDGLLTLFDAQDGSVTTQLRLDSHEIVPFEPQVSRVISDGVITLTWSENLVRKQCPGSWLTAYFDRTDPVLYLLTHRPTGEPFVVKPAPPPEETWGRHPLIVMLTIAIWILGKISGQQVPKPKQFPPHLRCRVKDEWVGVRLEEKRGNQRD